MDRSINRNPMNYGTNVHGVDEFGRKMLPELPWLPEACPEGELEPSSLLRQVQERGKWPRLVLSHRDSYEYRRPSEFIGSAYSPGAARLNIRKLPPQPKKPRINPYLRDGRLISPPRRNAADLEALRRLEQEKLDKKNAPIEGIITFDQLFTGEYFVKKEQEKKQQLREKRGKLRIMRLEKEKREEIKLQ